jgi:predicted molibdopterin-dependent oxidoreductase YjgC
MAGEGTKAAANLAAICLGDAASQALYVLPTEANAVGIRDMRIIPGTGGKDLRAMLSGGVKALLVVGDNPMMLASDKDAVEAALKQLDCLIVIDELRTETAELAHVVFADLPSYGKDGTFTGADRRLGRLTRAEAATGDQRDALETLAALAETLGTTLGKDFSLAADAETLMTAIASEVEGYEGATYGALESGRTRALRGTQAGASVQGIDLPSLPATNGRLLLTTSRTLYTSIEGAAIRSPEADKLHREEFLEINPRDAAALGIGQNRPVIVANGSHELTLSAALTDAVAQGSVFLPLYFEGGVVNRLLPADGALTTVSVRPA